MESQNSAKERGRDGMECSHGAGNGRGLGVQGICRGVRQSRETLHRVSEAETPRGHPQGTLGVVKGPRQSKKAGLKRVFETPHLLRPSRRRLLHVRQPDCAAAGGEGKNWAIQGWKLD